MFTAKCLRQNVHDKMITTKCARQNVHGKCSRQTVHGKYSRQNVQGKMLTANVHGKMFTAKCFMSSSRFIHVSNGSGDGGNPCTRTNETWPYVKQAHAVAGRHMCTFWESRPWHCGTDRPVASFYPKVDSYHLSEHLSFMEALISCFVVSAYICFPDLCQSPRVRVCLLAAPSRLARR